MGSCSDHTVLDCFYSVDEEKTQRIKKSKNNKTLEQTRKAGLLSYIVMPTGRKEIKMSEILNSSEAVYGFAAG